MSDLLFTKDTKGDRQNVAYGRPDQYAVPKYRNAGKGHLLGLTRDYRFSHPSGGDRRVVSHGIDSSQRTTPLSGIPKEEQQLETLPESVVDSIGEQLDYVSLGLGHAKKRRRISHGASCLTGGTFDDGEDCLSDSSAQEQSPAPEASSGDAYSNFQNNPIQARQRRLREEIAKNSNHVEAYLALVDLQKDLVAEQNGMRPKSTSQRRLVADLRISIIQDALVRAQEPTVRTRLIERLMKVGAQSWDVEKQVSEWQKLLKDDSSFEMSKLYLNFLQSTDEQFSVEKVVEACQQALHRVKRESNEQECDEQCIYIILRLTTALHQAGFKERAVAIWQALVEFNLFQPASLTSGQELSAFEDFWDSDNARVGELGAKGWSGRPVQRQSAQDEPLPSIGTGDIFSAWAASEQKLSAHYSLPARTFDSTDENDPDRVVLFGDIEKFVVTLTSQMAARLLLNAVLYFGGLPAAYQTSSFDQWSTDPYLCRSKRISGAGIPFTGVPDTSALFDCPSSLFTSFANGSQPDSYITWIGRIVELVALSQPQNARLGEYSIALEARSDFSAARKLARRLLKQSPDNILLYNAYALLETQYGSQEAGENVWTTSISLRRQEGLQLLPDTACIWHSWVWSRLRRNDAKGAYNLLRSIDGQTQDSTRRALEKALEATRASSDFEAMVLIFDLLALLEYLGNRQDLTRALESYRCSLPLLSMMCHGGTESRGSTRSVELLHQHRARLIDNHVRNRAGPFRPIAVLEVFHESAISFPFNSIFLAMQNQYRQKYGLIDRLRENPTERITPNLIQSVATIQNEMQRPTYAGATEHSIRAAFWRAEDDDSPVRTCPMIRLLHVEWEISVLENNADNWNVHTSKTQKRIDKASANVLSALHSALRLCPCVKEIYLVALASPKLRSALSPSGCRSLYHDMLNRGIRLHIDISDTLDADAQ